MSTDGHEFSAVGAALGPTTEPRWTRGQTREEAISEGFASRRWNCSTQQQLLRKERLAAGNLFSHLTAYVKG